MNRNAPSHTPSHVKPVLFVLFFLGFGVTLLAFVDLQWTHWVLVHAEGVRAKSGADRTQLQRLRQSILNVRVTQCGQGGEIVGTGFVVKPGFVATAAHVLGNQHDCDGAIRLIDYQGHEHRASLEGIAPAEDLALLAVPERALPALPLANTAPYEAPSESLKLVTIGDPLDRDGASSSGTPSVSGEGTLSRFDREHNVFVTAGLNLNAANGGGPVFIRQNWTVLGIARSRLPDSVGDGIGFVASMRAFESFFHDKTGQELR